MSDRKEIYLKYIDEICAKGDFDKEVLTFFVKNNGNIEDIIEGIEVLVDSENEVCKIEISNVLNLKKSAISNNLLYNISNYCVLNNAKSVERQNNNYKLNPFFINNKLFDKSVIIRNSYNPENGSYLVIEFLMNDIIPDNCNYELLDNDIEEELFNNFVDKLIDLDFDEGDYDYVVKIDINLTDCLNLNMVLMKNSIYNVCLDYINKINNLKKYNKRYFTKQIIERNVEHF